MKKIFSILVTFWKNFLTALHNSLKSRIRLMPEELPQGRAATIHSIFTEERHREFLQTFAKENGLSMDHVESQFRRYLHEIASDMNYLHFPFWDALLTWVFGTIYEGLEVDKAALARLRPVINAGKQPVIFVSNHRSHMDYLILSYIFYRNQIAMPQVCSGANLSFWPLGTLFRSAGAFFIRRSFEGNKLYANAVRVYVEEIIRQRVPMEFFIEGTRSRTGKLLPPKMGLLSSIAQSYGKGLAEEIQLVPTSVTYESVLEEKSYLEEQDGAVKKKEGFFDLFYLRKHLRRRNGKVHIRFGEPISLREFVSAEDEQAALTAPAREKISHLAYEVTYRINKSMVVTPASLVAMALLNHHERAISGKSLKEEVRSYLEYLRFKECPLVDPLVQYGESAVRETLKNYTKNHLIAEFHDSGEIFYVTREEKRSLLNYYKNTSLHFFVSMGVLATLLESEQRENPGAEIERAHVHQSYIFFQNLFQHEFTFSRRQPLESHLDKLLDYLRRKEVCVFDASSIQVHRRPESDRMLRTFSVQIRSYLETYHAVWRNLPWLEKKRWDLKELLKILQDKGRILYLKNEISSFESLSKFTLENALSSFRDLGLLAETQEGYGKKMKRTYTLASEEAYREIGRRMKVDIKIN